MKRSEMEMVILKALAELDVMYPDGYGYEEQASHILDAILEAGMLPPTTEFTMGNKTITDNYWDKEND